MSCLDSREQAIFYVVAVVWWAVGVVMLVSLLRPVFTELVRLCRR